MALRFLALFATISALYVCGALLSFALAGYEPLRFRRALPRWLAAAAPLLLIGHVVVVLLAATDNLTELMAGGGTIGASLCLALVVVGFAAATTALAGVVRRRLRVWIGAALLVTGLVIGWVFLTWGMADEITKYGRTFSALQFLLSPDRDHYTPSSELFTRYVLAFVSMIVVGALAQAPFMGRRGNRPADAVAPAIPPKT